MKYFINDTCAFKWARKLPRKTETYESAKCVPCNTRKCTHNGFVSDLLKCRFYATRPWARLKNSPTFFFESFLERLLTNLSLKFEQTRTTHPFLLAGEEIKAGFLPRADLNH